MSAWRVLKMNVCRLLGWLFAASAGALLGTTSSKTTCAGIVAIDIGSLMDTALGIAFNLGTDVVKAVTYYRPVASNPRTGAVAAAEVAVAISVIAGNVGGEFGGSTQYPGDQKFLVRASELTSIISPGPAPGDFIVITETNQRYDLIEVALDRTNKLYSFQVAPSLHEDLGDLTAAALSDDWGDLTTTTTFDDRGALFGAIV